MNPQYPIYIPSYSRWDSPLTARSLDYMRVPYKLVVQPEQYLKYAAVVNSKNILVLPKPWWKPGEGLIHVRNWIWDHARAEKVKRFWQMDDNIQYFFRLNHNLKVPVNSGTILRCAEDFTDRYDNVAQSGLQYFYFAKRKQAQPPFILNSRIYSCTLNLTCLPFKYELMYNDDTDMSLQCLQAGWCTINFNAFLCGKVPTGLMGGGNEHIYRKEIDGRLRMAEALQKKYPKICTIVNKWGRAQHKVNYSVFKTNELKFSKNFRASPETNNYGMELIEFKQNKSSLKQ